MCAPALATGLALTPVTAAQALPWGLTPVATVAGAADTWSAAADTVGNSAVAWVVGNRVWVSTRSVGSLIWEAPTPVSADPAVDASVGTVSNVDIDSSPNGHLAVVWTQTPPAGSADPDSEMAMAHVAFGLINSTPHSGRLAPEAMHGLLYEMALRALGVD